MRKENEELKKEVERLRRYKMLDKKDKEVWDDDLEYIKELKLQRFELKRNIESLELLLTESNKELWELKNRIGKAIEYIEKYSDYNVIPLELYEILKEN